MSTGFDSLVPFSLAWQLKFQPPNVANPQFTADGNVAFTSSKRVPGLPIVVPPNGVKDVDFASMGFTLTDFVVIQTITQGKPLGIKFDASADVITFKPVQLDNRAIFAGSASLGKVTLVNTDPSNPLEVLVIAVQG